MKQFLKRVLFLAGMTLSFGEIILLMFTHPWILIAILIGVFILFCLFVVSLLFAIDFGERPWLYPELHAREQRLKERELLKRKLKQKKIE